jgi:lipoprotein-anchoring transpeptidase ErfK/SrfK
MGRMSSLRSRASHQTASTRSRVSAGRFLTAGAAAAITCLAIGGAVGVLPGSALGKSAHVSAGRAAGAGAGTHAAAAREYVNSSRSDLGGAGVADLTLPTKAAAPASNKPTVKQLTGGLLALSVLPRASGSGKRIVYDISQQQVWLVNADDSVARTYRVSGGRYDNLSPGSYQVFERDLHTSAFDDAAETMNYMVTFTRGVRALIGFHDIPRYSNGALVQTKVELGQRLSAGCIRQWEPDAEALWNFAPIGTPVEVLA